MTAGEIIERFYELDLNRLTSPDTTVSRVGIAAPAQDIDRTHHH